jgi:spore germination cell wall hydrolase CwlJ-like protein
MGYSRIGWTLGIMAPWCLGMAIAVSISADAGEEVSSGASMSPLPFRLQGPPAVLIPELPSAAGINSGSLSSEARKLLREASLSIGGAEEFRRLPDEIEPRPDLKRHARMFPQIDRSHKGDPFIGLRPELDTRLRNARDLARLRADDVIYGRDKTEPPDGFSAFDEISGPETVAAFDPWPEGESPTTALASAEASPSQESSPVTMRPAALNERLTQGATPAVHRAIALGSVTPSPADAAPVEMLALPGEPRVPTVMGEAGVEVRPNYAALVEQDKATQERRCLAEAIYFEARGEPDEGQAAVAQVVLNRVSSGLYPATICGVVYQNRQHYKACQFSFACEGKSLRITQPDAWRRAVQIANEVTYGKTYLSDIGSSTHFHANYVRPRWARRLEKTDMIGHHVFYKLRPGQS